MEGSCRRTFSLETFFRLRPSPPVHRPPRSNLACHFALAARNVLSPRRRKDLVPCMRPDCTCRVFSTILRIVVHNFAHQLVDQLLADHAILPAS